MLSITAEQTPPMSLSKNAHQAQAGFKNEPHLWKFSALTSFFVIANTSTFCGNCSHIDRQNCTHWTWHFSTQLISLYQQSTDTSTSTR
jgi:hypothetical protein